MLIDRIARPALVGVLLGVVMFSAGRARPDPAEKPAAPGQPGQPGEQGQTGQPKQIRVLLIEGLPRWEYRFLANLLIRQKDIRLSAWLLSADEDFAQVGSPGAAITRLPKDQNEWDAYDVVLFGDVSPLDVPPGMQEQIAKFVSDHGGGFAMIAGPAYSPQRYVGTPIEKLLPVDIDPNDGPDKTPRKTGFKMQPTAEGRKHPVLQLTGQADRIDETLNGLPENYWYKKVAGVRKGATVLARRATTASDQDSATLLVAGQYGKGRTYFSAIDDTWRWRYHAGDPIQASYWRAVVRWLARADGPGGGEPLASGQPSAQPAAGEVSANLERVTVSAGPWMLSILPDGNGQVGYGSNVWDFVPFPKGTYDFAEVCKTLRAAGAAQPESSPGECYAVAFHEKGKNFTTAVYTKDAAAVVALFQKALVARTRAPDGSPQDRLDELQKEHPIAKPKSPG